MGVAVTIIYIQCYSMLTCRILDNLPVAVVRRRLESGTVPDMRNNVKGGSPHITYDRGFPVGFKASYETVSVNDIKASFHQLPSCNQKSPVTARNATEI